MSAKPESDQIRTAGDMPKQGTAQASHLPKCTICGEIVEFFDGEDPSPRCIFCESQKPKERVEE